MIELSGNQTFDSSKWEKIKEIYQENPAQPNIKNICPDGDNKLGNRGIRISINYSVLNETKWYE